MNDFLYKTFGSVSGLFLTKLSKINLQNSLPKGSFYVKEENRILLILGTNVLKTYDSEIKKWWNTPLSKKEEQTISTIGSSDIEAGKDLYVLARSRLPRKVQDFIPSADDVESNISGKTSSESGNTEDRVETTKTLKLMLSDLKFPKILYGSSLGKIDKQVGTETVSVYFSKVQNQEILNQFIKQEVFPVITKFIPTFSPKSEIQRNYYVVIGSSRPLQLNTLLSIVSELSEENEGEIIPAKPGFNTTVTKNESSVNSFYLLEQEEKELKMKIDLYEKLLKKILNFELQYVLTGDERWLETLEEGMTLANVAGYSAPLTFLTKKQLKDRMSKLGYTLTSYDDPKSVVPFKAVYDVDPNKEKTKKVIDTAAKLRNKRKFVQLGLSYDLADMKKK